MNNMKGFKTAIETATIQNANFRKVLFTAKHMQLVLMSLQPGEEIGLEIHAENDQFFRFEQGHGKCVIDGTEIEIKDGDVVIVPAGLKMYTIYSPPHHKDGIVRATKKEAEANEEEFDGVTTAEARAHQL
jgi:mannose-6-phosphate isomerase-like protein (cupin superfamily)